MGTGGNGMSIRSFFNYYDNKHNKNNMIQKQEFEDKLDNYLYHSIFKKNNAKNILDNIDVYPYKSDILNLLEKLSIFLNKRDLYNEDVLDKIISMELDDKTYCMLFNKLSIKQ